MRFMGGAQVFAAKRRCRAMNILASGGNALAAFGVAYGVIGQTTTAESRITRGIERLAGHPGGSRSSRKALSAGF